MAPIFVGSNNEDSRIRSNRIGFAASTADPGSLVTGDAYYNSTDNQLKIYDGSALSPVSGGGGTVELVASGTLSNGSTVIINSDGTVSSVSTSGPSAGTKSVFESANTDYISATFDSSNNKVVIAYKDAGNSNYGTAVVGTVSGTSISFGTPVVFESANTDYISATFDSSNNKVVIAYRDVGNSAYGTAIVGTVSGTSISFGSPVVFESAASVYISAAYDSTNGKVVIAYRDGGNSGYGTAIVGTVSGTSISFGSAAVFNSGDSFDITTIFDSSNNKVVIAYKDVGNSSYGTAIVGTVSGNSISFGSEVVFESASINDTSATFDSNSNKVVIAYRDNGNSLYGTAIVGTVSGTSISFGTPAIFESGYSLIISATFDSSNNKVVIVYRDSDNSSYGTAIVGTVSGTSISFSSPVLFNNSADTLFHSTTFDSSNNKVVIAYSDSGANSDYGTAVIFTTIGTNLTSENFIGFSDAAYSNGQTAKIQIVSSIDDAQTGLTTGSLHYVQNDGSLSTTAGNPSVFAGTALSGTEISIKN